MMNMTRKLRLRELAELLAKEVHDIGDAILIVREVATACAGAPRVNSSAVMLLAHAAGVLAAELGLRRGTVAVAYGDAYDATRHQINSREENVANAALAALAARKEGA